MRISKLRKDFRVLNAFSRNVEIFPSIRFGMITPLKLHHSDFPINYHGLFIEMIYVLVVVVVVEKSIERFIINETFEEH